MNRHKYPIKVSDGQLDAWYFFALQLGAPVWKPLRWTMNGLYEMSDGNECPVQYC